MRYLVGLIFFSVTLTVGEYAAEAADGRSQFMVLGAGFSSCESWTTDREADGPNSRFKEQWVLGYVTAMNNWVLPADRGAARNLAEEEGVEGLLDWMDDYCDDNPLTNVGNAVALMANEFQDRWSEAHPPQ
jgi:hypothetical protein